jgi:hypothetical protein
LSCLSAQKPVGRSAHKRIQALLSSYISFLLLMLSLGLDLVHRARIHFFSQIEPLRHAPHRLV